ncbi:hypothetical protein Ancab_035574 [Ancistrocladus abbreviatus]
MPPRRARGARGSRSTTGSDASGSNSSPSPIDSLPSNRDYRHQIGKDKSASSKNEVDYGDERSLSKTSGSEPPSPRKTEEDTSLPSRRVNGSVGGRTKEAVKRIRKSVLMSTQARNSYHKDDKDKGAGIGMYGGSTQYSFYSQHFLCVSLSTLFTQCRPAVPEEPVAACNTARSGASGNNWSLSPIHSPSSSGDYQHEIGED